jgi:histidinol-phosphate/aromatic aminotransferase/cobyric acid decarboxylase-like protein
MQPRLPLKQIATCDLQVHIALEAVEDLRWLVVDASFFDFGPASEKSFLTDASMVDNLMIRCLT